MPRYRIDVLTLRVPANYSRHDAMVSVAYMADRTTVRIDTPRRVAPIILH